VAESAHDVVGEEQSAAGAAERAASGIGAEAPWAAPPMPVAVDLRRLQRTAGNRATMAWIARSHGVAGGARLQREPVSTQELASAEEATRYAKRFAAEAGKRSLTDETRRLFRYVVKSYAPAEWARLGKDWTFDDYPFQDFTFAVMPDRAGTGYLLGIGPAFVKRIAAGELNAVTQEFLAAFKKLDKWIRSPETSGAQPAVPGLGPDTTAGVAAKIAARDPQGALDLLVGYKIREGVINPSFLVNGAMVYDPDLKAEDGICSMQSWDYIKDRADPTLTRIGPGAFSSVAYLYSVVMHEWQHVRQRQSKANQENEKTLRAQQLQSGNEVEAYAWELMHARESGVKDLPNRVAAIWRDLNSEFWKLDRVERAKVASLAQQARARAVTMVTGTGITLVPFQAP
jgi:hypothetical protein